MKKVSIILTLFIALSINVLAQGGGPPLPPTEHGENGNQDGGTAPIGSGLFILLGLAGAYGIKKLKNINKEELED